MRIEARFLAGRAGDLRSEVVRLAGVEEPAWNGKPDSSVVDDSGGGQFVPVAACIGCAAESRQVAASFGGLMLGPIAYSPRKRRQSAFGAVLVFGSGNVHIATDCRRKVIGPGHARDVTRVR